MFDYSRIKCPYCFKYFSHDQVLFRSATALNEVDLDPTGRGESLEDIEFNMPDGQEKTDRINEYHLRENFLIRDDEKYNNFWNVFGSTSETNSGVDETILDYRRPILNPNDRSVVPSGPQLDEDGFVYKIEDYYGRESHDRICPHCHNPLPPNYGKFPVKFLSVIGISSAGKTVFLSKLIENIGKYAAKLGMSALPASASSRKFVRDNLVGENAPLPGGNPIQYMSQPLFYNLTFTSNGVRENKMFVIYDIAGESCVDVNKIHNFAKFVSNSDGMLVLLDPEQFKDLGGKAAGLAESVLATLKSVFVTSGMVTIPLALCISKSDMMKQSKLLPDICFEDVRTVNNKQFCAEDYNQISDKINDLIEKNEIEIKVALKEHYLNFNFFAFTTLNCDVRFDDKGRKVPEKRPDPKRIEEPLYWLFKEFGFIASEVPVLDHSLIAANIKEKEQMKNELMKELSSLGVFKFHEKSRLKDEIQILDQEIYKLKEEKMHKRS